MRISILVSSVIIFVVVFVGLLYFWRQPFSYDFGILDEKKNIVPIAIIGSGPAGLSAALYSARLGFHTVVFEGRKPGGQLTETGYVENWPGVGRARGADIMNNMRSYVSEFGVRLVASEIKTVNILNWPFKLILDDNTVIYALSLVIATGSAPRVLDVTGEREYWGKGVTTCALCDAPFYKGKDVAIIGGGDSACEHAVQLAPYARRIVMLARGGSLRASAAMQKRVRELPQVVIATNRQVHAITGDGSWVSGINVYDKIKKNTEQLSVQGIFLAIGYEPRIKLIEKQLKLSVSGHIWIDEATQQTSVAGVFAAGDVADAVYRQAGVAAGAGIKAAIQAMYFLQKNGWNQILDRLLQNNFYRPELIQNVVKELTSVHAFDQEVLHAHGPVIVDFYAHHCPSCMQMLPMVESVAYQFKNQVKFFKVNTAAVPALEEQLKIERIPCFIVFKKGKQIGRYYSFIDKERMINLVQQSIQADS